MRDKSRRKGANGKAETIHNLIQGSKDLIFIAQFRELGGQFPKEQIHTHRITIGHDQEARFTSQRLHCSIGISVLPYMMTRHTGTGSFFTPAVFGLVDPSETSFILEHQTHVSPISSAIVDFRLQFLHFFFNFFEVSMTSSLAFFGCLLRGITFLQPCRRST